MSDVVQAPSNQVCVQCPDLLEGSLRYLAKTLRPLLRADTVSRFRHRSEFDTYRGQYVTEDILLGLAFLLTG